MTQQFNLQDHVILVTGAAGALCAPICRAIAQAGGLPVLAGRTLEKLEVLAADIRTAGGACDVAVLDVSDPQACRRLIDELVARHGRLDGIVNGAYGGRAVSIEHVVDADFELASRQNLAGPFALVQQAIPALSACPAAGGGAVVNIASMYGKVSPDPAIYGDSGKNNPPFYGATKAGLIQLTRYLAVHLAQRNIRVNSVSPGPFPPPSIAQAAPAFHAELCRKTPMGRIGAAEELAGPVLFLLSDAATYVTGVDLAVDGGWTAW